MVTEPQAKAIAQEIEKICNTHGLWHIVEYDKKPGLKMIRIKEICIKISGN